MAWRKMRRKRGDQQQLGGDRERNRSGKDLCEEVEKKSSLKLYKMVNEMSRPERYGSSWEGYYGSEAEPVPTTVKLCRTVCRQEEMWLEVGG